MTSCLTSSTKLLRTDPLSDARLDPFTGVPPYDANGGVANGGVGPESLSASEGVTEDMLDWGKGVFSFS